MSKFIDQITGMVPFLNPIEKEPLYNPLDLGEFIQKSDIPDLMKSVSSRESKSIVEDPLSLLASLNYKEKPTRLTYQVLSNMAERDSVVAAIIVTRVNQVSSFSQPSRTRTDGVGYEVRLRDVRREPTEDQMREMLAIENFIEQCGYSYDPGRDSFDTFLRKIVRDSLIYDQMCFEIVPDRRGYPAEILAVDASSIRAGVIDESNEDGFVTQTMMNESNHWVQIVDGVPVVEFTSAELAFAVRNPRTDMNVQPYGLSELEVLIHQVTAHLWAEEYNSKYFSQGGTTKGILNLKGHNISKEQLDAFRRQWTAQIAGITGAWKTPVVSVDGLEYLNVSQSNREMEYEMWMNYLINVVSAVYQIDPAEINFPNRGGSGGSGGGLGEGGIEDRLKNSKDKGLRPLLRFIESTINRFIVRRFSSNYAFSFTGLDKDSEAERKAAREGQVRTIRTVNELRAEEGIDPLPEGDIILDTTFMQYKMQVEQAKQMEAMGGGMGEDPDMEGEEPQDDDMAGDGDTVAWEGSGEMSDEELDALKKDTDDDALMQSLDRQ